MARLRVFISSTYYDLKSIREDLNGFIMRMGYEPVLHESGHISYGSEDRPESYAYKEVEGCDILVSIIGGKFGTQASGSEYSISQKELKRAFDLGKQVYIFVEKSVLNEFNFYKSNKDLAGVQYSAVNDTRVYSFLEEIYLLPKGNPVFPFDTGLEVTKILQEQWAGLFERLLSQEANRKQASLTEELQRSLQTVDQLVKFLTEEKTKGSQAVEEILFSNHPIFEVVRSLTRTSYRIYFTNLTEFNQWASASRNFSPVEEHLWDGPEFMEWVRELPAKGARKEQQILFIHKNLFDSEGHLKPVRPSDWDENWVRLEKREMAPETNDFPDDIPF